MSHIIALHMKTSHAAWLDLLDFYDKELDALEKRLAEVSQKHTSLEVRSNIEHFQNQFIVQRNNIDELKHSVNENARFFAADSEAHGSRTKEIHIDEYEKIEDDVATFKKVVDELRVEFYHFFCQGGCKFR